MRASRFVAVVGFLLAGAALSSAAMTTAFDPVIDAVLARRSALDPASPRERRTFKSLGRVARELATPSTSLSGDLRIASRVIGEVKDSLKPDVELRSIVSVAFARLSAMASAERDRLSLWTGKLLDAADEARLAAGLAETDRLFARAQSRRGDPARARLLARGCDAIESARGDLGLAGDPPVMPDFSIADVNPAATTFGQPVSPRDYLDKISAWYFGKAG